jgi:hypothetical protein
MELTLYGIDIYTVDVDDRGIDFVARASGGNYFEFQVKSVRESGYIFLPKASFELRPNLFAAVVVFKNGEVPHLFLVPSLEWLKPNDLLRDRKYEGKKSPPEWGINISAKNWELLEQYRCEKVVRVLGSA